MIWLQQRLWEGEHVILYLRVCVCVWMSLSRCHKSFSLSVRVRAAWFVGWFIARGAGRKEQNKSRCYQPKKSKRPTNGNSSSINTKGDLNCKFTVMEQHTSPFDVVQQSMNQIGNCVCSFCSCCCCCCIRPLLRELQQLVLLLLLEQVGTQETLFVQRRHHHHQRREVKRQLDWRDSSARAPPQSWWWAIVMNRLHLWRKDKLFL